MKETEIISAIRYANQSAALPNLVNITVCNNGNVVKMHLNAAGLVKALQLNAVHCYREITDKEILQLCGQVGDLYLREMSAHEVLQLAARIADWVSEDGALMLWGAWVSAFFSAEIRALEISELTPADVQAFCGRRLLFLPQGQEWQLTERPGKDDENPEAKLLWAGEHIDEALCQQLARFQPAVSFMINF